MLAALAVTASGISCAGSSTQSTDAARPISAADVVDAVAPGLNDVRSLHADTEFSAFAGDDSAVLIRMETWADFEAGEARTIVSEPVELLSDEFVTTEETVVVDDLAFRRSDSGEWGEVDEQIQTMVLAGLGTTGNDFQTALTAFVLDVPGGWNLLADDENTQTYRSDSQPDGTFVEVGVNIDGRPVRITWEQRASGAELDEFPRYRTIVDLSNFDATIVEIPTDLPVQ